MAKKQIKLHFGKVKGQYRLSQVEEQKMADRGEKWVRLELTRELNKALSVTMLEMVLWEGNARARFNSLIRIYVQLAPERITKNVRILMGWSGLTTVRKVASKTGIETSFFWRMLALEPTGLGGWHYVNLFRVSNAFGVDPRLLLFSDLGNLIREQNKAFTA